MAAPTPEREGDEHHENTDEEGAPKALADPGVGGGDAELAAQEAPSRVERTLQPPDTTSKSKQREQEEGDEQGRQEQ